MRSWRILIAAGVTVAVILAGLLLWEFVVEEWVMAAFFPAVPPETPGQRWLFFEVTLGTAIVAAVVPLFLFLWLAGRHARVERELALARERATAVGQKALLEAVFEAIPDAVATSDMDRRLISVNRGFTDVCGYTAEEIAGKSAAVLYEDEREFHRRGEILYNPAVEGPSHPYIVRYRRKNGEVFPAEVRGGPIRDAAGTKIGFLAIIRDVTERLALERRLQEVRKMEAVGQLTAGIAHDFNNLLQVIQGNVDLAAHLVGADQRVRELLANALEASRRGARVTRQLLAFGRRDILHTRTVEIAPLIEGLLGLLKSRLGDGVRIVTDMAAGLPPIAVDPRTLETALLHVADNARAAMPDGGALTIRAAARQLDGELAIEDGKLAAGAYVEITVTDTGCGMSERVRERAFEPFFTTRAPNESSGLGLSVVQGFARQSGGHAALTSTVGKGTAVTLLLPVAVARGLDSDPD